MSAQEDLDMLEEAPETDPSAAEEPEAEDIAEAAEQPAAKLTPRRAAAGAAIALAVVLVGLLVYLFLAAGRPGAQQPAEPQISYGLESVLQIGGPGAGKNPNFDRPMGVAIGPEGRIYVADAQNNRVAVFSRRGRFLTEFGGFGVAKPLPGGAYTWKPGRMNYPTGIDVDEDGTVYVADFRNDQIQVFDSDGTFLRRFPDPAKPVGKGSSGQDRLGIAVTDVVVHDGKVYATDAFQVFVFTTAGEYVGQFGKPGAEPGDLDHPNGVAVAEDGTIYVSDSNHNRVTAFGPDGTPRWNVGLPVGFSDTEPGEDSLGLPRGLTVLSDGRILVADAFNFELVLLSPQGEILQRLGVRGDTPAEFNFPNDVDSEGAEIAVADRGNDRV